MTQSSHGVLEEDFPADEPIVLSFSLDDSLKYNLEESAVVVVEVVVAVARVSAVSDNFPALSIRRKNKAKSEADILGKWT